MKTAMVRSLSTGEVYVTNGLFCTGPLRHEDQHAPLDDYSLDDEAPDWLTDSTATDWQSSAMTAATALVRESQS